MNMKTMDGGKTWEKILFTNESTGVADMVMDPSNPNKLIVAMWEYYRKPWTMKSGGEGSAILASSRRRQGPDSPFCSRAGRTGSK